jgi:hypothetical protein
MNNFFTLVTNYHVGTCLRRAELTTYITDSLHARMLRPAKYLGLIRHIMYASVCIYACMQWLTHSEALFGICGFQLYVIQHQALKQNKAKRYNVQAYIFQ